MPMPVDKLWDLMRPGKKGGDGSLDSYPFLRSQVLKLIEVIEDDLAHEFMTLPGPGSRGRSQTLHF